MSQTPENPGTAIGLGERLRQARERAGLSIEKVAKDLYLDPRVIQAIEINHFKDLGAPVYAKGYIRKYARLVGIPEEDVLIQYQQSADALAAPDLIPHAMGTVPESRKPLPRWILWLVIGLIVLAGVATLLNLRDADTEPVAQGALISRPLSTSTSIATASDTAALSSVATDTQPAGAVTLRFSFTGDSWVEVYDARNQQILYELGTANGVREVTAPAPLRVVLGAAEVVRLKVNSQDVAVPPANVQAGIARFLVKADGSLE